MPKANFIYILFINSTHMHAVSYNVGKLKNKKKIQIKRK